MNPLFPQNSGDQNSFQNALQSSWQTVNTVRPGGSGKNTLIALIVLLVMVPAAFFGYFIFQDKLFPNAVLGDFIDAVYIPDASGSGKIWFQTDGSFHYINETSSPGNYSVSNESLFNKIYTYIYDPVAKKVVQRTRTDYNTSVPHPRFFLIDNQIWTVNASTSDEKPIIEVYDPSTTTQKVLDTNGFISKYPELSSGISEMTIQDNPDRLVFTTLDGQEPVYDLFSKTMYKSSGDFHDALAKADEKLGNITEFSLSSDELRKELYLVNGPAKGLRNGVDTYIKDADTLKFFTEATATRLLPEKVFIQGYIVYQDKDIVVILHQAQAGDDSNRLLTAVGADGKERWTLGQSQLFPELALKSSDAFSDIFFIKGDLGASRGGDMLIFKMKDVGILGIDVKTGEVKWTFRI